MEEKSKLKFRAKLYKLSPGTWSFGLCFSHDYDEYYIYINLFKVTIAIGFMYDY